MLYKIAFFLLFQCVWGQQAYVDPADLISERGYPVEKYTVQTEDGYLISLFRIPHGINGTETNKYPVLLNHGLTSSAGDYVNLSPKRSLGYVLADRGYDVWVMSCRGTTYSTGHISIDEATNKAAFYNFSWHEIGYYDIPASIDFILNKTNQEKVQYVGHSQGGTSFLAMASTRKEYNDKIRLATLMAPSSVMSTEVSEEYYLFLQALINVYHIYDSDNNTFQNVTQQRLTNQEMCINKPENYLYCLGVYNTFGGYDPAQIDQEVFDNIFKTIPSNAAIKQTLHYAQLIRSGKFQLFDYGTEANLVIYNSTTPPEYDLRSITSPVSIFAGNNDTAVPPKDAELLADTLANAVHYEVVPYETWCHGDFLFAVDIDKYLYRNMIGIMDSYKN